MLSNHLITLPLYDDCTKLWICPMSLKKRGLSLKPKYISHSFNSVYQIAIMLWLGPPALIRIANLDLSFASGPHYIPPPGHPLLPASLHNIPCSGHTLLSYLCIVTSLLAPPPSKPWDTYFQDSSCILSSKAFLSPPGTSYQDDFTRALILQYLSLWLHCELPDYRDCIPDLCIPSVSRDGHQMIAAQMLVPRGPSNMYTVMS